MMALSTEIGQEVLGWLTLREARQTITERRPRRSVCQTVSAAGHEFRRGSNSQSLLRQRPLSTGSPIRLAAL